MSSAQNNFYAAVVCSGSLHGICASMIHAHIPLGTEITVGEKASANDDVISRLFFLLTDKPTPNRGCSSLQVWGSHASMGR